jgi:Protein of unknown function (DUF4238)
MASDTPKRHHYVPRFLLRRFTDDPEHEKKGRLVRLAKATGKPERASVLNEAVIGHYYTVMREDAHGNLVPDLSVERDLAAREAVAAKHVRRLLEPGARLTDEERRQFAEFIHLSRQRTPLVRAWLRYAHEVMSEQWRDVYGTEPTGLAETPHERELQGMFMALDQAAGYLTSAFTWTLLRAPAGASFVIGDTPIALVDVTIHPELGLGYGTSPATETTFPLDPFLCLHLQLDSGGAGPWVEREATRAEVEDVNLRSYAWAQHSIYGSSQAAVTAVRALAKANPHRLARYAAKSGKLWFGEEIDGEQVWDGFSATEAGIKPNVRR